MASYPIHFTDQLRQHLRALRKKRGLTQAQLGDLVGVSQARIAEIEANPGLISVEQLLKLFSALGATMTLAVDNDAPVAAPDKKRRVKRNLNFRLTNMAPGYETTYSIPIFHSQDVRSGRIAALSEDIGNKYSQYKSTGSATPKGGLLPTEKNQKPIGIHFKVNEPSLPQQSVKLRRFTTDQGLQEKLRRNFAAKTKKGSW